MVTHHSLEFGGDHGGEMFAQERSWRESSLASVRLLCEESNKNDKNLSGTRGVEMMERSRVGGGDMDVSRHCGQSGLSSLYARGRSVNRQ
jgi:hypothetical protein